MYVHKYNNYIFKLICAFDVCLNFWTYFAYSYKFIQLANKILINTYILKM